ncbi:hypothetical protein MLD38_021222 [Melastoma candidum]|uniref:Uncharacterized protein n=1 Tax=Melastoma candidum TaxID=119954 RepID=A0ACB9QFF8_9MYRT|nr:hypothetical protein MLD38_021222 [Melastoma candidum]
MKIVLVIAAIWSLLLRWLFIRICSYCRLPSRNQPRAKTSLLHSSGRFDPFSLVANDLSVVTERLRVMEIAEEVPEIASAVRYYFKPGAEGKMFRPAVLLLMATALGASNRKFLYRSSRDKELCKRQQLLAEITEMIHVASLMHDDILDDADTRRGVPSLNVVLGNKIAVLAGDFLLSQANTALASLENIEVMSLLATVVQNLIKGESMQATTSSDQRFSMQHYMQKTYYKTASLFSNSCKAIAVLADHTNDVSMLAYDYGKNLGLSFQLMDDVLDFTGTSESLGKDPLSDLRNGIVTAPVLFAIEEYPQLREVVERGFNDPSAVDLALSTLGRAAGYRRQRTWPRSMPISQLKRSMLYRT